jgi:Kdo2-lipid IVA lauroyltransferase/acyltransferase
MVKRGRLQTKLEYALARSVFAALGIMPRSVSVTLSRGLGRLGYWFFADLRRTARRNLDIAFPELSQVEKERIVRGCFESLGRILGEFSHFGEISKEQLRKFVHSEGLENLPEAKTNGRPIIFCTAHLGFWELTSFWVGAIWHPFPFLVRRLDNDLIEEMIDKVRRRFGNTTLDKKAVSRQALRMLNQGGTIGMLPDVNMLAREGVFVDFFGTPASTTSMMAKLALRTDAMVIPVYSPWDEKRKQFLLQIEPPITIERTGDDTTDVHNLTAAVMASIEKFVRRYPEQWLWIHRRWKTRPPGEPDLY